MGILNNGQIIAITTVLADLGITLDMSDPSRPKIGSTFGVIQNAGTNPDFDTLAPGVYYYEQEWAMPTLRGGAIFINFNNLFQIRFRSRPDYSSQPGANNRYQYMELRGKTPTSGWQMWTDINTYVGLKRKITSLGGASIVFNSYTLFANTTYNCTTPGITNMNIWQYIKSDDEIVINFTPAATLVAGDTFIWNSSYFNKNADITFNAGEPYEINIRNGIMRIG